MHMKHTSYTQGSARSRTPIADTWVPGEGGALQSLLHIHVGAAVVNDNEVEVVVSSDAEQLFHVGNQLLNPATLVFH